MGPKWARNAGLLLVLPLLAQEPPADLVRRVAARETENEAVRADATYRQTVLIEEMNPRGGLAGRYREVRDIIYTPGQERSEQFIGKPVDTLRRLKLTEEDFRDLREVQPMLLTTERLPRYEARYRGTEAVDGRICWVLQVRPRQILATQRLFDGLLWIDPTDFSIVQTEGRAVPQILGSRQENLFPAFRTFRKRISTGHWLPVLTVADDTLPFKSGPLRMRMRIEYAEYKRFGSESFIVFADSK